MAVDYTEARYVCHMKGGGSGMATYERERALHTPPADFPQQSENAPGKGYNPCREPPE